MAEEALKFRKSKLGADRPDTLITMNNLALTYLDTDRLNDATALFEEAVKRQRTKLGLDNPKTLATMNNLAAAILPQSGGPMPTRLRERVWPSAKKSLPDDWRRYQTMSQLGCPRGTWPSRRT